MSAAAAAASFRGRIVQKRGRRRGEGIVRNGTDITCLQRERGEREREERERETF